MTPPPNPTWRIKRMTEADLPRVLVVERDAQPAPWTREIFLHEMSIEWAQLEILEDDQGQILGYTDCWFVHDELHILNIAVATAARRQGCARYMLEHVFAQAQQRRALYVTLEVRIHNAPAIKLYEHLGFETIGKRPGYYADTGEAALIMAKLLPPPPE